MKIGAEKKGELVALLILAAVAVLILWRSLAPEAASPPVALAAQTASPVPPVTQLDPRLHLAELERVRGIEYAGTGRDLFHFGSVGALPAPGRPPSVNSPGRSTPRPVVPLPPPGPPPPPPIPLRFYGFAQAAGAPEKIFLQMGDDNYVVVQGDVIEHRYQIENIGKVSVRVKDLVTQSIQDLPLQQN